MRVSIPIVLSAVAGTLGAQLPVNHNPGIVLPIDFDENGKDEFVVVDGRMISHSYTGFFGNSVILPGPSQQLVGSSLLDLPVVNDRTVFAATIDNDRMQMRISSYAIQGNAWLVERSTRLYLALADPIATVQITPFHRDIDGDGQRDLLVVWTEARPGISTTYCIVHSPTRSTAPLTIQRPPFAPTEVRAIALEPAVTPSLRDDEYLVGFSAADEISYGGFGFVLIKDGNRQAGGTWFPMLPTLLADEMPVLEDEAIAYGCFSPFPRFGVPLVKTAMGRSARLGLDPSEPFVARRGEVLRTTLRGKQLPRCIADFDDNGTQDMVWVEYLDGSVNPSLVVADPGPYRRELHVVPLGPSQGQDPIFVHHGASGDFDGDGDPDIVLSVQRSNPLLGSGLIYIRTERDYRHRRTTLRRVQ